MHLELAEYQGPIPEDVRARYPQEGRARAHLASRLALKTALEGLGRHGGPQFLENDPTTLLSAPDLVVSLSHSRNLGGALVARRQQYPGVGLDLEWADRALQEGGEKYYRHGEDQADLTALELWCMKEAAFKALFPFQRAFQKEVGRELLLKDIWVREGSFGILRKGPGILGRVQREVRDWKGRGLLIAQANLAAQISLPTDAALE